MSEQFTLKGGQYAPEDSVKLNGPPGTGKTTQLLERVTRLLDSGYEPNDVVFVTYRKEMAKEFLRRLHERGHISKQEYQKPWENDTRHFGTLHGVCNRITSDAAVVEKKHRRDFMLKEYRAKYDGKGANWDDNPKQSDPIGTMLFDAYDWCVENKQHSFVRAPNYAEIKDKALSPPSFEDFSQAWESYMAEGNEDGKPLRDFAGMLREVDEGGLRPSGDVLVVDEYHDMTPIMASICEGWFDGFDTVIVGGDPLQCVPEGEMVETPSGQVPIEDIAEGDSIVGAGGGGESYTTQVDAVSSREHEGDVMVIETPSATLRCTPEHEVFAGLGPALGEQGRHFLYVMASSQGDYRVGITQNPKHRHNAEPGAAAMMVIDSFEDRHSAQHAEDMVTCEYGIPQAPFQERERPQRLLDRMYDTLNTKSGFESLCEDRGIDPDNWHLVSQSSGSTSDGISRGGERVAIRLKMCRRRVRGSGVKIKHHLKVEGSNPEMVETLRDLPYSETSAKSGRRFRRQSSDYWEMRSLAYTTKRALEDAGLHAEVDEKASFASFNGDARTSGLPVVSASQVVEGMFIPVRDESGVSYEQVKSVAVQEDQTTVYDLHVPPIHNYSVGGAVVHNSIYTYKGADPSFFTDLDLPEILLDRTYRVPSNVWSYARGVISHDPPDIEPDAEGGEVRAVAGEPHEVIGKYGEDSTMFLARTQSQLYDIAADLKNRGIIFRSQEGIGGWNTSRTLLDLFNALQKVRGAQPADNVNPNTGQTGMARYGDEDVAESVRLPSNVTLESGEAKRLVQKTPASYFTDTKKSVLSYIKGTPEVSGTDLLPRVEPSFWNDMTRGEDSLDHLLTYDAKDTLRAALERYDRPFPVLQSAPVPDVLTIHASKGKEADTVALYDGIPGAVQRNIRDDPREKRAESRVWYVGCTRAAENLLVFRDQFDYTDRYLPSTA